MLIRYGSIEQLKHTVRSVQHTAQYQGKDADGNAVMDRNAELPTLTFKGTVKIHGTNAGIRRDPDGSLTAQSRERELTLTSDNAGFCMFMHTNLEYFSGITTKIAETYSAEQVVLFGEWAGGSIQKSVAITGLPHFFSIFDKIMLKNGEEDIRWLPVADVAHLFGDVAERQAKRVYFVTDFGTYEITINFNAPEQSQNQMVDLTLQVEAECPVGKFFGKTGVGEGIVWETEYKGQRFIYKVKGKEHSNSKVKTVAPVDEAKFAGARTFAENYTTPARMEQGFTWLTVEGGVAVPTEKDTGTFMRWVIGDIMKEEQQGVIENQIDTKVLSREIGVIARKYYLDRVQRV